MSVCRFVGLSVCRFVGLRRSGGRSVRHSVAGTKRLVVTLRLDALVAFSTRRVEEKDESGWLLMASTVWRRQDPITYYGLLVVKAASSRDVGNRRESPVETKVRGSLLRRGGGGDTHDACWY